MNESPRAMFERAKALYRDGDVQEALRLARAAACVALDDMEIVDTLTAWESDLQATSPDALAAAGDSSSFSSSFSSSAGATERFGDWSPIKLIAEGSMSSVSSARHVDGAIGALKVLRADLEHDTDMLDMFHDEAAMHAAVRHPGIVAVLDSGTTTRGRPFLVTEFVVGATLDVLVQRQTRRFDIDTACYVVHEMAVALHAVHEAGDGRGVPLQIIHRDLRAENVLIDEEGVPRVFDFGLVHARQRRATTRAGVIKGSWSSMSPEQLRGLPLDRRCDVWALGFLLYHLLGGPPLSPELSLLSVLERLRRAEFDDIAVRRPDLPAALAATIRRTLQVGRDERTPTAAALAHELAPWVGRNSRARMQAMLHAVAVEELSRSRAVRAHALT